jgi:hypothetical protein
MGFVFNVPPVVGTVKLPINFETWEEYSTMYRLHVWAEIKAEIGDNSTSAKHETFKLKECAGGRVRIQNGDQGDYHLAVVRISGSLRVLKRDEKNRDWYSAVAFPPDGVLPVEPGDEVEVLTTLSEYTKLLVVLSRDCMSPAFKQYLLGNVALPQPSTDGWQNLQTKHDMTEQQAKAVARYLNMEGGVNLLEGPPRHG